MKRIILLAAIASILSACGSSAQRLNVYVFNPLNVERTLETIEIPWDSIASRIAGITVDSVAVFNGKTQIPSQVVYNGKAVPQSLIFQVTLAADKRTSYTIAKSPRAAYPKQAFGRYVPERMDDYAWENNVVAFRVYGPALKDPLTPGIDVWCKRTDELVIDNWYKINDYHHDHGQGMDCYKVGQTLGGGGSTPYVDGKLWYSGNYASWETLDNGPLRTSVKLTYAPFNVNGDTTMTVVKYISLDANTRFSKISSYYDGNFERMAIAAGINMHNDARTTDAEGYVALTESASDTKDPVADGDISIGVIMQGITTSVNTQNHWLIVAEAAKGEVFTYWAGSGWSKNGVENDAAWKEMVEQQSKKINNPLQVSFKR